MLVLARRQGESLELTGGIKVTVVTLRPGQVRIGITAPRDVRVWRSELQPRTGRAAAEVDDAGTAPATGDTAQDERDPTKEPGTNPDTGTDAHFEQPRCGCGMAACFVCQGEL